jgi:hypothetical protein
MGKLIFVVQKGAPFLLPLPFLQKHTQSKTIMFNVCLTHFVSLDFIYEQKIVKNNFNGTLPSELSALLSLEELSMWGNSLQGTLPSYIGIRLRSLQIRMVVHGQQCTDGECSYDCIPGGDVNRIQLFNSEILVILGSIPESSFVVCYVDMVCSLGEPIQWLSNQQSW